MNIIISIGIGAVTCYHIFFYVLLTGYFLGLRVLQAIFHAILLQSFFFQNYVCLRASVLLFEMEPETVTMNHCCCTWNYSDEVDRKRFFTDWTSILFFIFVFSFYHWEKKFEFGFIKFHWRYIIFSAFLIELVIINQF